MELPELFQNATTTQSKNTARDWHDFLTRNRFDFSQIEKIDFATPAPTITDKKNNKFCIDFINDKKNYHKKKLSIKSELLSKALGGGKLGLNVLDLSAGLGIDTVFLAQLGYHVTAIERNPLIYLCLQHASEQMLEMNIKVIYDEATKFLKHNTSANQQKFDVIYFDPMFPEKTKSALPRQEMVFFKKMVGSDEDAGQVLEEALKTPNIKRVVVKRPLKAPPLLQKPSGSLKGKLVRFDIYGVEK
ncbi:MAG: hypothetical protein K0R29_873 [Pseudobdellovibrio sp.]|jgi:16S rRNA (guanine1516-N2)-methyltransferase|nr:hypothetical protein [Pseudobdellovibrio sp.]